MTNFSGEYFINNPIFLKFKKRFDFKQRKVVQYLKNVFINERIVEMPFAIQCVSGLPAGSRILDLGCGESPLPLHLAVLGYQVTGFDFRPYPYTHSNFKFVQGDILELPFANESFDAALSVSTIEHLGIGCYDDPKMVESADLSGMASLKRVLAKSGLLVFTAPYGVSQINQHQRVYDESGLTALFQGFKIKNKRYFRNITQPHLKSNSWEEVSQQEAAQIKSERSTSCVVLIQATKE